MKKYYIMVVVLSVFASLYHNSASGQYLEEFDLEKLQPGWSAFSGDGEAEIKLVQNRGHATLYVDATRDRRNIWWAVIRHRVESINTARLIRPGFELRVEAKLKVSHAPRRINLHFNHQRTTDYHSHLKEYDIPDTTNWHTVSMTTGNFDVQIDDSIYVQMALMDWGNKKYRVDIDYIKVDVVERAKTEADLGNPLTYHPPIRSIDAFSEHIEIQHDATIDAVYQDYNFNQWRDYEIEDNYLLSVGHQQTVILRTDFAAYRDKGIEGGGLLEMRLFRLQRAPQYKKDFGMFRLVEVLGGKTNWQQEDICYQKFLDGDLPEFVFNGQMVIDVDPAKFKDNTIFFTISEPVMQRLVAGKTRGLALFPLGAVKASFFASESKKASFRPKLHFNLKK
jgi:hypothetical protein